MKYFFILFILINSQFAFSQSEMKGELLIQTNTSFHKEAGLNDILPNFPLNASLTYSIISSHFQVVRLMFDESRFSKKNILQQLQSHPNVLAAQVNHLTQFHDDEKIPNDALYSQQWDMDIIDAPKAWNLTTGGLTPEGDTIVIAVIDAGADFEHEDLKDNLWFNHAETPNDGIDNDNNGYIDDYKGWSYLSDSDNHPPTDHGTATAGIVGARGGNGIGVTGTNWNVKLMILSQALNEADVIAAYDYIYEMRLRYHQSGGTQGAFVVASSIAQSFGGDPSENSIWCRNFDKLGEIGILNVAATINSPVNVDEVGDIPTSCNSSYLLTVTNTSRTDELRSTAGFGKVSIDLGAPGSGSFTLTNDDAYDGFAGTSAAAPHVSGAIGLMYALPNSYFTSFAKRQPNEATLLVKSLLLKGTDYLPTLENKTVSEGRLNVFNSLQLLDNYFSGYSEKLDIAQLYPNPVEEILFVQFETPIADFDLMIFNELGQVVEDWSINTAVDNPMILEVNTARLQGGVYFLKIKNDNEQVIKKFVKL